MFGQYQYMPHMMQAPQQIQRMQPLDPVVKCWFVSERSEMETIRPDWNTIYIGINKATKEIYTKQMKNDGTIDFSSYSQNSSENLKATSDFEKIIKKLNDIETRLGAKNESNVTNVDTTVNGG